MTKYSVHGVKCMYTKELVYMFPRKERRALVCAVDEMGWFHSPGGEGLHLRYKVPRYMEPLRYLQYLTHYLRR